MNTIDINSIANKISVFCKNNSKWPKAINVVDSMLLNNDMTIVEVIGVFHTLNQEQKLSVVVSILLLLESGASGPKVKELLVLAAHDEDVFVSSVSVIVYNKVCGGQMQNKELDRVASQILFKTGAAASEDVGRLNMLLVPGACKYITAVRIVETETGGGRHCTYDNNSLAQDEFYIK